MQSWNLSRWLFPKPRIFISYAREDAATASWLLGFLGKSGYSVYMDTRGTLAGEQFLSVIVAHLRRCDAVLALVSKRSATSEWCQAELYYAHALKRPIIPLRINSSSALSVPAPLDLLQRETQYVVLDSDNDRTEALRSIRERFRIVRRRAHLRWVRRCVIILTAVILVGWGFQSGFAYLLREKDRRSLLSRLEYTQSILDNDVLEQQTSKFKGDQSLHSRLAAIAEDPDRPMHTRLNAQIIAAAIDGHSKRWYLEGLSWGKSTFRAGQLTNVTFRTGAINSVNFDRVSFSDVVWNRGPDFNIGGTTFARCRFNGGEFLRTNVIDCEFINCFFAGTILDVTGFGAVRFKSYQQESDSEVITGGEVCSFQNAVITNCRQPSAPGVLDLSGPKNEVMFTGVVFDSCRFRGFIRPAWFDKCSFDKCVFPAAMSLDELNKANTISDSSQHDEPCGDGGE